MRKTKLTTTRSEAGFSLIELMIALCITLIVAGLATSLLASSFSVRAREDRRSEAIADVQRAINIMTREIANTGYRLPSGVQYTTAAGTSAAVPINGIIPTNSGTNAIRIVANLDATSNISSSNTVNSANDTEEDVQFSRFVDADGSSYLVRHANNRAMRATTVLANRIDSLTIRYYDEKVTYTQGNCDISGVTNAAGTTEAEVAPGAARYVVIAVCVELLEVGTPGTEGHQPASRVQLVSDVVLRNATPLNY